MTMTRIFGHYIHSEMAFLFGIDFILSFLVIAFLLGNSNPLVLGTNSSIVSSAAALAFTACLISVAIGLYRPETCRGARLLLVNVTVAGTLALPIMFAINAAFGVGIGDAAVSPLNWVGRTLVGWVICLLLTRALFALAMRMNIFVHQLLVVAGQGGDAELLETGTRGFFRISTVLSSEEFARTPPEQLSGYGIWGIVVASSAYAKIAPEDLLRCQSRGIRLFRDVEFREQQLGRVDLERLPPDWLVFAGGFST